MCQKEMTEKRTNKEYRYVNLHNNWYGFIKYCEKINFGEIQNLKIQNGLPQVAEIIKKKIDFSKGEGNKS